MDRKTKIVCTIGPACSSGETMAAMVEAGMNVARLNFSHGTLEQHRSAIESLKRIREETGRNIGILQDLSGPKIRTGLLPKEGIPLETGSRVRLVAAGAGEEAPAETAAERAACEPRIPVQYPFLLRDVPEQEQILLDDGRIGLRVERKTDSALVCRVVYGGLLKSHKGVNFPDLALSAHAPTPKDLEDLRFGLELGVDFVALSFVQAAEDLLTLREQIRRLGSDAQVIAKLERKVSLDNLDAILRSSDGVMVARGDLGIEADLSMIPIYQKKIVRQANLQRVQVITATQMLDSMIRNPLPTRAEVTDVANAIYDGSDAIMLSGETAVGRYPVEAVRTMRRIADNVERNLGLDRTWFREQSEYQSTSEQAALADAVCASAGRTGARCIVACTAGGYTARLLARNRPEAPIVALTAHPRTFYRLSLVWGVESILLPRSGDDFPDTLRMADRALKERGWASDGDLVIVAAGIPASRPGGTNIMKLHRIGEA